MPATTTSLNDFYSELQSFYKEHKGDEVLVYLDQHLKQAHVQNDSNYYCAVLNELAGALRIRGRFSEAQSHLEYLLSYLVKQGVSDLDIANAKLNLGSVYAAQKLWDRAIDSYNSALESLNCCNVDKGISYIKYLVLPSKRYSPLKNLNQELLETYEPSILYSLSSILNNRSVALREACRLDEALSDALDALHILEALEFGADKPRPVQIMLASLNCAEVYLKLDHVMLAKEFIDKELNKLDLREYLHLDFHYAYLFAGAAELLFKAKSFLRAAELYKKAYELYENSIGDCTYVTTLKKNYKKSLELQMLGVESNEGS